MLVKDHMRLQLEDLLWTCQGAKEGAIRWIFDESPTKHAAAVQRLIDDPEAIATYPTLTARLRRLRDARRQQRTAAGRSVQSR